MVSSGQKTLWAPKKANMTKIPARSNLNVPAHPSLGLLVNTCRQLLTPINNPARDISLDHQNLHTLKLQVLPLVVSLIQHDDWLELLLDLLDASNHETFLKHRTTPLPKATTPWLQHLKETQQGALAFFCSEGQVYGLTVNPWRHPTHRLHPLGTVQDVRDMRSQLLQVLQDPSLTRQQVQHIHQQHQSWLVGVLQDFEGVKAIQVMPDDLTRQLPLGVFRMPDDTLLARRHPLIHVTSFTTHHLLMAEQRQPHRLLVCSGMRTPHDCFPDHLTIEDQVETPLEHLLISREQPDAVQDLREHLTAEEGVNAYLAVHAHFAAGYVENTVFHWDEGTLMTLRDLQDQGFHLGNVGTLVVLAAAQTPPEDSSGLALFGFLQAFGAQGVVHTLVPVWEDAVQAFVRTYYRQYDLLQDDPGTLFHQTVSQLVGEYGTEGMRFWANLTYSGK